MGSKCCKCSDDKKATSAHRSSSTYSSLPRSRARRRMVGGDDVDLEELPEDDRWPEQQQQQWTGTGRPHLVRRLSDLSVKVGTRARFLVEVSSPTPVSVRWEKDGRTVDEGERVRMVAEGHFHCVDISPVILEDSGLWRVVVTNMVGTTISSAQLSLLIPKAYKKPEFVEPLRAILTVQGTVSLECKVVGVPTPLLRWFKGGAEIKAGDVLALTPNQADPTSLGTYTCLATNCMGSTESSSIVHVDVSSNFGQSFLPLGPKPIVLKELRNEKSKLGGNVTFECKVSVPPWPDTVIWYGPSGEIAESVKYHKLEEGAGVFKLRVTDITAEDNGVWKCVVSNKTGAKAISSANLSVNYPKNYRKPKFLENLKAILTEEGLVSFECKVVGYPTPHLSWFKDGQELKPGDVYQLTGTNSLGSYCCIAKNCMGEAESTAVLTLEDIKSQLTEEDRLQLSSEKLPPRFIQGLKSAEAKINETLKLTVQVSVFPEPTILWFKDDEIIETDEKYKLEREKLGVCHLTINKLEFSDQAEWKCVATNDYGQSVTSCFLKLNIPKHFKKPKFLEDLKAVMSEEGAVNLECKVIGVPQPKLKWFKDGRELKPGDIHKIITGQDGTCCLGTYTCLAQNCMGSVSSSASLLGFEDKGGKSSVLPDTRSDRQNALMMDRSLSTIHEERTSQLHDTTDKSGTIDDRAEEVSFSFDGKEVSVSLYETPDLTEEEALQIVEMYAEQISEHVSEHNVVELPPMRFTKESSNSGKLLMEAVVIDVSPEYFNTAAFARRTILEDDLRTDVDMDELSFVEEDQTIGNLSPDELMTRDKLEADFASMTGPPTKPPRGKHKILEEEPPVPAKEPAPLPRKRAKKKSTDSEKEDDSLKEFERRKKSQMPRKRTESELEDDSLYEFESRKKDDVRKSSPETGVAQTTENESVFFTAAKSQEHASVASKKSEDEATFDTAEDSAFDRSEISVLESLAQSLHEFQREIANVEATSDEELHSALAQSLHDVQKSLEAVEVQIESAESPLASELFETLKPPLAEFHKITSSIENQNLSSLIQSVQRPLEVLTHEVALHLEHEKSVEQVQANLTEMIERESSVPGDKQIRESVSKELLDLEEKANDELEKFYDRLLTVGTELRHKVNQETDEEIVDVLRSVSDLIKPLKKLTSVTSKVIGIIVEDSEAGMVPSKKTVESLMKPLDALHASVTLLENISMLRSHRAIRGAGIPVLYKVTVPMDELHTTVKLVENLSAHSAFDFLTPPLGNLIKVVTDIDITSAGEGFLEDLPAEGIPILKTIDDSLEIIVNCLGSIEKGVLMDDTERGIANKMPVLIRPIEELQKALKSVEREILNPRMTEDEAHSVAHEVSRPLQSIRSEFSILQHEIEADCSPSSPSPVQNTLMDLIEPLEVIQNCITSFHEAVICKAADDPIHLRFVMYALKEMCEPFSALCGKMIKTEETLLGRGDPYRGLRAVARSVSELRESSVALTRESSVAERMSEPLGAVQNQLEKLITLVEKDELNEDLLECLIGPIRELQSAMLDVEGVLDESTAPDLYSAVKDLQNSILTIQESKGVNEIYLLAEPIHALRTQFNEMQRVVNKSVIKAERELSTLLDCTRRVSATVISLKQNRKGSPMGQVLEALGDAIEEIESVVELSSGQGKRIDDLTVLIDNTLRSSLVRLTDICAKADDLYATVEQKRRKSFVHMQDLIHDLKSGLEHSSSTLTHDTLSSIQQLTSTIAGFHGQLMSVEDLAIDGVSALKKQVDRLDGDLDAILRSAVVDKSNRLVLETVITDIHSVQRVVDNLVQENVADSARLRFVLTKIKSIMDDLEDINKYAQSNLIKQACRSALSALNVGEVLLQGRTNSVTTQPQYSVIGELLEVIDELESRLIGGEQAEVRVTDGLGSLRVSIQRIATGASGDLLDQTNQICEPLKYLGEKLAGKNYEFVTDCLDGINEQLESILMPKQATTSIIGELLENVNDLEMTFEKFKSKMVNIPRESLNQIEREIIALQNMVDELTSQASGDLLDKAYEICIPVKSIEAVLMRVSTATQSDVYSVSEQLGVINKRLIEAKTKCVEEKNKREKEFEKLFSSESLNLAVDVPIVKSIVKTVEFMQAHLATITVETEKQELKDFLNKFESHLIQFGESLVIGHDETELMDCVIYMEEVLKSFKDNRKEIQSLKDTVSKLKSTDPTMSSVLPVLQAVLTPLRELHEDLSRPGSPREVKKAELKYLDEITKHCNDLEKALTVGDAIFQAAQMVAPVELLTQTMERICEDQLLKGSDEESVAVALKSLASPICDIRDITRDIEQAVALKDDTRVKKLLSDLAKPIEEITIRTAALQEQVSVQEISLSQIEELKQAVALMTKVPDESPELKAPLMTLHARLHDLSSDQEMAEVVSEISQPVESLKQAVDRLESRGENSILLEMCHQMIDIIQRSSEECSELSSLEHSKANERAESDFSTARVTSHDVMDSRSGLLRLIAEVSDEERTLTVPLGRLQDKLEKNEDIKANLIELKQVVSELKDKGSTANLEKSLKIINFAEERVISEINGLMSVSDVITVIDLIECDSSKIKSSLSLLKSALVAAEPESLIGEVSESLQGQIGELTQIITTEALKDNLICQKLVATLKNPVKVNYEAVGDLKEAVRTAMAMELPSGIQQSVTELYAEICSFGPQLPVETVADNLKTPSDVLIRQIESLENASHLPAVKLCQQVVKAIDKTLIQNAILASQPVTVDELKQIASVAARGRLPRVVDSAIQALQGVLSELPSAVTIDSIAEQLETPLVTLKEALTRESVNDKAIKKIVDVIEKPLALKAVLIKPSTVGDLQRIVRILAETETKPFIIQALRAFNASIQLMEPSTPIETVVSLEGPLECLAEQIKEVQKSQFEGEFVKNCKEIVQSIKQTASKAVFIELPAVSQTSTVGEIQEAITTVLTQTEIKSKIEGVALEAMRATLSQLNPVEKLENVSEKLVESAKSLEKVSSESGLTTEGVKMCREIIQVIETSQKAQISADKSPSRAIETEVKTSDDQVDSAVQGTSEHAIQRLKPEKLQQSQVLTTPGESKITSVQSSLPQVATVGQLQMLVEQTIAIESKPGILDKTLRPLQASLERLNAEASIETILVDLKGPLKALETKIESLPENSEQKALGRRVIEAINVPELKATVTELLKTRIATVGELQEVVRAISQMSTHGMDPITSFQAQISTHETPQESAQLEHTVDNLIIRLCDVQSPDQVEYYRQLVDVIKASVEQKKIITTVTEIPTVAETAESQPEAKIQENVPDPTAESGELARAGDIGTENVPIKPLNELAETVVDPELPCAEEPIVRPETVGQVKQIVNQILSGEQKPMIAEAPLVQLKATLEQFNPDRSIQEIDIKESIQELNQYLEKFERKQVETKQIQLCRLLVETVSPMPVTKSATVGELQQLVRNLVQMECKTELLDVPLVALQASLEHLNPDLLLENADIALEKADNVNTVIANLEIKGDKSVQVKLCRQLLNVIQAATALKTSEISPTVASPQQAISLDIEEVHQFKKETIESVEIPKESKKVEEILAHSPKNIAELREIIEMAENIDLTSLKSAVARLSPETSIADVNLTDEVKDLKEKLERLEMTRVTGQPLAICRLLVDTLYKDPAKATISEMLAQKPTKVGELQVIVRELAGIQTISSFQQPLSALKAKIDTLDPETSIQNVDLEQTVEALNSKLSEIEDEGNKTDQIKLCRQVIDVIKAPSTMKSVETSSLVGSQQAATSEVEEKKEDEKTIEMVQKKKETEAITEILAHKPIDVGELKEIIAVAEELECKEISLDSLKSVVAQLSSETQIGDVNLTEQTKDLKTQLERLKIERVTGKELEICGLLVETLSSTLAKATISEMLARKPTNIGELRNIVHELGEIQTISTIQLPLNALKAKIDTIERTTSIEQANLKQPLETLSTALDTVETEGNKVEEIQLCRQMIEILTPQLAQSKVTETTSLAQLKPIIAEITNPELKPLVETLQTAINRLDPQATIAESAANLQQPALELSVQAQKLVKLGSHNHEIDLCSQIAQTILLPEAQRAKLVDILEIKQLSTVEDLKLVVQGLAQTAEKLNIMDRNIADLTLKIDESSGEPNDELLAESLELISRVQSQLMKQKVVVETAEINKCDYAVKLIEAPMKQKADTLLNTGLTTVGELKSVVNVLIHSADKPEILNQKLVRLKGELSELKSEDTLQHVQDLSGTLDAIKRSVESLRLEGNKSQTLEMCRKMVAVVQNAVITEPVEVRVKIKSVKELMMAVKGIESLKKPEVIKQGLEMLKGELSDVLEDEKIDSNEVQKPLEKFAKIVQALETTGDESSAMKQCQKLIESSRVVSKTVDQTKAKTMFEARVTSTEQLKELIQILDVPSKPKYLDEIVKAMRATLELVPQDTDIISAKVALQDSIQQLRNALKETKVESEVQLYHSLVEIIQPSVLRCSDDLMVLVKRLENHPKKSKLMERSIEKLKTVLNAIPGDTSIEKVLQIAETSLQEMKVVSNLLNKAGFSSEAILLCDQITDQAAVGSLDSIGVLASIISALEDPQQPHSLNQAVKSLQNQLRCLPQEERLDTHFDRVKEEFNKLDSVVTRLEKVGSVTESLSACQIILTQVRPLLILDKGVCTIGELKSLAQALLQSVDTPAMTQALQSVTQVLDTMNSESTLHSNLTALKSLADHFKNLSTDPSIRHFSHIIQNPSAQIPVIIQTVQTMLGQKQATAGKLTQIVDDIDKVFGSRVQNVENVREKLKEFDGDEKILFSLGHDLKTLDQVLDLVDVSVTQESLMKQIAKLGSNASIGGLIKVLETSLSLNPGENEQALRGLRDQLSALPLETLTGHVNLMKPLQMYEKSLIASSKTCRKILETLKSAHLDYVDSVLGSLHTVQETIDVIDCFVPLEKSRILETSLEKVKSRLMTLSPDSSIQNTAESVLVDFKALKQSMGRESGRTECLAKRLVQIVENAAIASASQRLESVSSVHDLSHVVRTASLVADDESAVHFKKLTEQLQSMDSGTRLNECALQIDTGSLEAVKGQLKEAAAEMIHVVKKTQEQQFAETDRLVKMTKDVASMKASIQALSQCVTKPLQPILTRLCVSLAQADDSARIDSVSDKAAEQFDLLKQAVDKFEIHAEQNKLCACLIEIIDGPLRLKKARADLNLKSPLAQVIKVVDGLIPLDHSEPLKESLSELRAQMVTLEPATLELVAEQLENSAQTIEKHLTNDSPILNPCRQLIDLIQEPSQHKSILEDFKKAHMTVKDLNTAVQKLQRLGSTPILEESLRSLQQSLDLQSPDDTLETIALNLKDSLKNLNKSIEASQNSEFSAKNLYNELVKVFQRSMNRASLISEAREVLALPVSPDSLKRAITCLSNISDKEKTVGDSLKSLESKLVDSKYQIKPDIEESIQALEQVAKQTSTVDLAVTELCCSLVESITGQLVDDLTKTVVNTVGDLKVVVNELSKDAKFSETAQRIKDKINFSTENSPLETVLGDLKPLADQLVDLADSDKSNSTKLSRHLIQSIKRHETAQMIKAITADSATAGNLESLADSLLDLREPNRDKLISLQHVLKQFDANETIDVLAEHLHGPLETLGKAASSNLTKLFLESVQSVVETTLKSNKWLDIVGSEKSVSVQQVVDVLSYVNQDLKLESIDNVINALTGVKTQNLDELAEQIATPLIELSQVLKSVKPIQSKTVILGQKLVQKILPRAEKQIQVLKIKKLIQNQLNTVGELAQIAQTLYVLEPKFKQLTEEFNDINPNTLIENASLSKPLSLVEDYLGTAEKNLVPAIQRMQNVMKLSVEQQEKLEEVEKLLEKRVPGVQHMMKIIDVLSDVSSKPTVLDQPLKKLQAALSQSTDIGKALKKPLDELKKSVETLENEGNMKVVNICRKIITAAETEITSCVELEEIEKLIEIGPKTVQDLANIIDKLNKKSGLERCFTQINEKLSRFKPDDDVKVIFGAGLDVTNLSKSFATCKSPRVLQLSLRLIEHLEELCRKVNLQSKHDSLLERDIRTVGDLVEALKTIMETVKVKSTENLSAAIMKIEKYEKGESLDSIVEILTSLKLENEDKLSQKVSEALDSATGRMKSFSAARSLSQNLNKLEDVREVVQNLRKSRVWDKQVIQTFQNLESQAIQSEIEPFKALLDRLSGEMSQTNQEAAVVDTCRRLYDFVSLLVSDKGKINEIESDLSHMSTICDLGKCVSSILTFENDQKTVEQCLIVLKDKLEKMPPEQGLIAAAEDLVKPFEALMHNLKFVNESSSPAIPLTQKLIKSVERPVIQAAKIMKVNKMIKSQLLTLGDLKQVVNILEQVVPQIATDDARKLLKEIESNDLKQPVVKAPEKIVTLFEALENKVKTVASDDNLTQAIQGLAGILQKPKVYEQGVKEASQILTSNLSNVGQLLKCTQALISAAGTEGIVKPLRDLENHLQSLKPDQDLVSVNLAQHVASLEIALTSESGIAQPCQQMITTMKTPVLEQQVESLIKLGINKIKDLIPVLQLLLKFPEPSVLTDSISTLLKKSERLLPEDSIEQTIQEPIKILDKLVTSLEKDGHKKTLVVLTRKTIETIQAPILEKNILAQTDEQFKQGTVKTIKDLQQVVQALSQIPNKPQQVIHGLLNLLRHLEQFEPDSKLDIKYETLEPALNEFEKSMSGLESTKMTSVCRQIVQMLKTDRSWINEAVGVFKEGITDVGQAKLIVDILNKNMRVEKLNEKLTVLASRLSLVPPTTELENIADKLIPTVDEIENTLQTELNVDELKLCKDIVKIIRTSGDVQSCLLKAEGLLNKHPVIVNEFKSIITNIGRYPRHPENVKQVMTQIQTVLGTIKDDETVFSALNKLVKPVESLENVLARVNDDIKAFNLARQLAESFRNCFTQDTLIKQAEEALKKGHKANQLKIVARLLNQIEHKPKVVQVYLLEINEQLDSSTSDTSLHERFNQLQPVLKNLNLSTSALKKEGCKWLGLSVCENFAKTATTTRPERRTIERIIYESPKLHNSAVSTVTSIAFQAQIINMDEILKAIKDMKTAKNALDLIIEMPERITALDESLKSLGELIDRGIESAVERESEKRLKDVEKCLSSLDSTFKRSGIAKLCLAVVNIVRQYIGDLKLEKQTKRKDETKAEMKAETGKEEPEVNENGFSKPELNRMEIDEQIKLKLIDEVVKETKTKDLDESKVRIEKLETEIREPRVEYTTSVTTKTKPRDISVHSTRGITVVELMDYCPPDEDERPQRRYRRSRPTKQLLRDYKSQDYLPITTPVRDYTKKYAMSSESIPSQDIGKAYKWDRSKGQNWKHLEFSTADIDFESPSSYHRSRRASSPYRDVGSSPLLEASRYQPAPVRTSSRGRRSISPFEKALTTTSYSNISLSSSRHLDQLTSARIRPATPTRSVTPVRSRSIGKLDHFEKRAYICNGLSDKTVVHGGRIRLTCNITGDSDPSIDWLKDGKPISLHTETSRYKTTWNFGVAGLEVDSAMLSDSGQYTCIVKNVDGQAATTCTVRVVLKDDDDDNKPWETIESELEANMPREICLSIKGADIGMPRVTGLVADPVVPSGGTIAVHVQVAGCHQPDVTWLHAGKPLPRYSPRVHYLVDGGLYTLLLEGATPAESGVYTCRVFGGRRGAVDTTTTIQVVERRCHEKPAQFTVRPDTRITLSSGEDMTLTCYVTGEPRPQVFLMRGIKDITSSCRTLKETFGEYVRLTLKRVTSDDRGTYFILVRNIYGTDRAFVTLQVRERDRSPTPLRWLERTSSLSSILKETSGSQPSLSHWKTYSSSSAIHSSFSSLYQ